VGSRRILIALSLALVGSACAPDAEPPSASTGPAAADVGAGRMATPPRVRVVGSWEGPEAAAFQAVLAPFEARTGTRVEYIPTRDPLAQLEADIEAGDPSDIVALPSPALLARLARAGLLVDLGEVVDLGTYKRETAPAFLELGTIDGMLFGVAFKGAVKGLMWYDPSVYIDREQTSWVELQHSASLFTKDALKKRGGEIVPWCVTLESAESSGWPGTDWVEDFLLRQSGPDAYDAWVAGDLPWTSPEVAWAFQSYGLVVDSAGDTEDIVERNFSAGAEDLLGEPPRCLFLHQGSFMPEFLEAVSDRFEFMPFPDIDPAYAGSLIGGGDLLALADDTPAARELLAYLVSAEAQQILVDQGGALSGNLEVTDYPDAMTRRMARMLANANVFRFDASDSMAPEVEAAFREAVLDYTADPGRLDALLRRVQATQSIAGGSG
jgi:alpha-glucoside transport system substrate-binding protein